MGAFRFLLAIAVALSHVGVSLFAHNPGVVAVVSFFLLSGYVMAFLIQRHYASLDQLFLFYLDRAARIFPQYIFYILATGLLVLFLEIPSSYIKGCEQPQVALNLIILPLQFFQFPALNLNNCLIIPPAWSLGLELSFYAIAPLLILTSARKAGVTLSILVFLVATFGIINTDTYGYRVLPGTLFMFLVGAAIASPHLFGVRFHWWIWLGAVVLALLVWNSASLWSFRYSRETLMGLIVGIPALVWLRTTKTSQLDTRLGNLSYGIFLNHFICIWLLEAFNIGSRTASGMAIMISMSIALSIFSFYAVEAPILDWRRRFRHRFSPAGKDGSR